jgi:hypothetical protein
VEGRRKALQQQQGLAAVRRERLYAGGDEEKAEVEKLWQGTPSGFH